MLPKKSFQMQIIVYNKIDLSKMVYMILSKVFNLGTNIQNPIDVY